MNFLVWIIFGALAGWIASIVMGKNRQMGAIANVLVGVVGSGLGAWIAGLLGIAPVGGILSFAVSLGGAVLLIALLSQIGVFKKS